MEVHIVFIDFKQAFDSLKRISLLKDAEKIGIPRKLLKLVTMTLKESRAAVMAHDGISSEINIEKGVRQGDGLATVLLNVAMEGVIRASIIEASLREKEQCR